MASAPAAAAAAVLPDATAGAATAAAAAPPDVRPKKRARIIAAHTIAAASNTGVAAAAVASATAAPVVAAAPAPPVRVCDCTLCAVLACVHRTTAGTDGLTLTSLAALSGWLPRLHELKSHVTAPAAAVAAAAAGMSVFLDALMSAAINHIHPPAPRTNAAAEAVDVELPIRVRLCELVCAMARHPLAHSKVVVHRLASILVAVSASDPLPTRVSSSPPPAVSGSVELRAAILDCLHTIARAKRITIPPIQPPAQATATASTSIVAPPPNAQDAIVLSPAVSSAIYRSLDTDSSHVRRATLSLLAAVQQPPPPPAAPVHATAKSGTRSSRSRDESFQLMLVSYAGDDPDPRVRHTAMNAVLARHYLRSCGSLSVKLYTALVRACGIAERRDDTRALALHVMWVLSRLYPSREWRIPVTGSVAPMFQPTANSAAASLSFAGDVYTKLCIACSDVSVRVRESAMRLLAAVVAPGSEPELGRVLQSFSKKSVADLQSIQESASGFNQNSNRIGIVTSNWLPPSALYDLASAGSGSGSGGTARATDEAGAGWFGAFVSGGEDEFKAVRLACIRTMTDVARACGGTVYAARRAVELCIDLLGDDMACIRHAAIHAVTILIDRFGATLPLADEYLAPVLLALSDGDDAIRHATRTCCERLYLKPGGDQFRTVCAALQRAADTASCRDEQRAVLATLQRVTARAGSAAAAPAIAEAATAASARAAIPSRYEYTVTCLSALSTPVASRSPPVADAELWRILKELSDAELNGDGGSSRGSGPVPGGGRARGGLASFSLSFSACVHHAMRVADALRAIFATAMPASAVATAAPSTTGAAAAAAPVASSSSASVVVAGCWRCSCLRCRSTHHILALWRSLVPLLFGYAGVAESTRGTVLLSMYRACWLGVLAMYPPAIPFKDCKCSTRTGTSGGGVHYCEQLDGAPVFARVLLNQKRYTRVLTLVAGSTPASPPLHVLHTAIGLAVPQTPLRSLNACHAITCVVSFPNGSGKPSPSLGDTKGDAPPFGQTAKRPLTVPWRTGGSSSSSGGGGTDVVCSVPLRLQFRYLPLAAVAASSICIRIACSSPPPLASMVDAASVWEVPISAPDWRRYRSGSCTAHDSECVTAVRIPSRMLVAAATAAVLSARSSIPVQLSFDVVYRTSVDARMRWPVETLVLSEPVTYHLALQPAAAPTASAAVAGSGGAVSTSVRVRR